MNPGHLIPKLKHMISLIDPISKIYLTPNSQAVQLIEGHSAVLETISELQHQLGLAPLLQNEGLQDCA
jgi:hypothetical protein